MKEGSMPTSGVAPAVVEMLKQDHEKVKGLFEEFQDSEGREQAEIAKTAIQELEVHAQLEEKLIYPAIREVIDEDEKMNEAVEEHHVVHVLIGELKKLKPSDERFQAKFSVLSELVKHHIEEEEGEILPKAEESDLDWEELEVQVMKKKEQLMGKAKSGRSTGNGRASKPRGSARRKSR
jgi:hemerythrin superfamily protein